MFKPKSNLKNNMKSNILALSFILIIGGSIISQDASASILSASMKNPPQATADLLTLNNTSGTHLWWVNSNGKMFAASNADFTGSTVAFDQSGILIRNPAHTFTYTLTGSAIVANRTLNIPLTTGTDTLATLGLAQTFTAVNTFSGGIVMSGAEIKPETSIGTELFGMDPYLAHNGAINLANNTVSTPFGNTAFHFSGLVMITETGGGNWALVGASAEAGSATIIYQSSTTFSTTKNTNTKHNVYVEGNIFKLQNLSGGSDNYLLYGVRILGQ